MSGRGNYDRLEKVYLREKPDKYDALMAFGLGMLISQIMAVFAIALTDNIGGSAILQLTLIAFVLIYSLKNGFSVQKIGLRRTKPLNYVFGILIGLITLFVSLPLVDLWIELLELIGINLQNTEIVIGNDFLSVAAAFLVLGIMPAFGEEFLMRGLVVHGLAENYGKWKTVFISAALFALLHGNPVQLIHPFIVGAIMAYLVFETGSIIPAMLLHGVNNTFTLTLSLVSGDEEDIIFGEGREWLLFAIALVLTAGLLVGVYFYNRGKGSTDGVSRASGGAKEGSGQVDTDHGSEASISDLADNTGSMNEEVPQTYNQKRLAFLLVQQEKNRIMLSKGAFLIAFALCVMSYIIILFGLQ